MTPCSIERVLSQVIRGVPHLPIGSRLEGTKPLPSLRFESGFFQSHISLRQMCGQKNQARNKGLGDVLCLLRQPQENIWVWESVPVPRARDADSFATGKNRRANHRFMIMPVDKVEVRNAGHVLRSRLPCYCRTPHLKCQVSSSTGRFGVFVGVGGVGVGAVGWGVGLQTSRERRLQPNPPAHCPHPHPTHPHKHPNATCLT